MIPHATLTPSARQRTDALLRAEIRSDDRRQSLIVGLLGLIAVGAAAALIAGVSHQDAYGAFLGGGLLAIIITFLAATLTERRQRGRVPRPRVVGTATQLPAARGPLISIGALLGVVGVTAIIVGIVGFINGDALRGVLLLIVGVLAFGLLPTFILKQLRRSGMVLTADGFSRGDGTTDPVTPWENVRQALIAGPDSLRNDNRALAIRVAAPGIPDFYVVTRSLCLSLWELLEVLDFYADNPDARTELGTDRSLHRIDELTAWPIDATQVDGLDWFRTPRP